MEITQFQDIGPRDYQEDRLFVRTVQNQYTLLAVFDGHGLNGHMIPEACLKYLDKLDYQDENIEEFLKKIVADLHKIAKKLPGGSTCTICYVNKEKAYIAVLGDSPIWVMDNKGKIHSFRTHNVADSTNPDKEEIRRRGGSFDGRYLCNGWSYLAMTRSLGDKDFKGWLIEEPDVYTIDNPISVALFSDGFTCGTKIVEDFLNDGKKAEDFFEFERDLGLRDNFTSVIYYK